MKISLAMIQKKIKEAILENFSANIDSASTKFFDIQNLMIFHNKFNVVEAVEAFYDLLYDAGAQFDEREVLQPSGIKETHLLVTGISKENIIECLKQTLLRCSTAIIPEEEVSLRSRSCETGYARVPNTTKLILSVSLPEKVNTNFKLSYDYITEKVANSGVDRPNMMTVNDRQLASWSFVFGPIKEV